MDPIVIMGGFLSSAERYVEMSRTLAHLSQQPVSIVDIHPLEWFLSVHSSGWVVLLDKLDCTVQIAAGSSPTGKVSVIGHSVGGVLAHLYLGAEPFHNRVYAGSERVSQLVTLGSPHHNQGGWRRGGALSRWVERRYPGAYYAGVVQYMSVAGKWVSGSQIDSRLSRFAYKNYQDIGGNGATCGDGIIPIESALLPDSRQIVLENVSHDKILSNRWYGNKEVVPLWWNPD